MTEHRAVQAAGLGAVEELLVTEPEREGGQVLVSHLPDQRLLLSAHLKMEVLDISVFQLYDTGCNTL